ncbi:hypothetical protein IEO21_08243 [Rhodonia placenta]|uniref:Uncharacterized protein n=1 Tax=Rhodonia placenta TaxID=104341 RepID=A0A8H7TZ03_9APHY|nr:hypothetical protein IEO21_08243 [Postia placenta]
MAETASDFNNIPGYTTIGTMFGTVLYGIAVAQMYYYTCNYTKDPIWLKILISMLRITDTFKEISCIVVSAILKALMSATSLAIVSATMYVLSTEDTIALQNIDKLTIALDVISLLTDLYITVSLCVIFRSTRVPSQPSLLRNATGRSEGILGRLTKYTANRGILLWYGAVWIKQSCSGLYVGLQDGNGCDRNCFILAWLPLNARHYINEAGEPVSILVSSFIVRWSPSPRSVDASTGASLPHCSMEMPTMV